MSSNFSEFKRSHEFKLQEVILKNLSCRKDFIRALLKLPNQRKVELDYVQLQQTKKMGNARYF